MTTHDAPPTDPGTSARTAQPSTDRGILLVCLAVFGLMTGQQMVNPVLPPLARELGFSELALGAVWTIGASGVVVASSFWARRSVVWGHRPVLVISLVSATGGLLGFALVTRIGLIGVLPTAAVFGLVLLTRGVVFGLAWAATPVTALSYVARQTSGSAERVRGMSLVGAAQGLGLAAGPALGGIFSLFGLVGPVYAAPLVVLVVTLLVVLTLPRPSGPRENSPAVRVSPRDPRMWPFLITGFVMYLGLTLVLMTVGFLLQDRLHLSGPATGRAAGLVMVVGATMIIVVQAVGPRLRWPPLRLVRLGAVLMTLGMGVVWVAPGGPAIGIGVGLLGAGLGVGLPGFTAAPTLLASAEEQGAVAGLLGTSSASAFMVGPLLGTGLYTIAPGVPYLVGTVLLAGLTLFVLTHPGVRRTPGPTAPQQAGPAGVDTPTLDP